MSRTYRGLTIASTLLLVAMLLSACEQPYSTPPVVTNTPIDSNSLFTTPIPDGPSNMQDVENITTQTAVAALTTPVPASGVTAPAAGATVTPTPIIELPPTATQAVVVPPTSTSAPVGSVPATYTLKNGEFPFCIARRFNIDPGELLAINGFASGDVYYAGLALKLPQTGHPWPDGRALNPHTPSQTHTVTANQDTVYAVACFYGDVDPAAIAQANGISVDATLTVGQQLKIP